MSVGSALAVLAQVRFHDGTKQPYSPPRDTMDPRWRLCADHRPACDCREAEFAERYAEAISEAHEAYRLSHVAGAITVLHSQRPPSPWYGRYPQAPMCSACGPNVPWPCPTLVLVAEIDWHAKTLIRGRA